MAPALNAKISGNQVVRSFTAALINLGCGRIYQFAVRIEGAQKPDLVERRIGFNSLQRFGIDEKRCLHGAIVSPKSHGAPRCIEKAALVWKTKRHGLARAPGSPGDTGPPGDPEGQRRPFRPRKHERMPPAR